MLKKLKQKKQLYLPFLIVAIGINLLGFLPVFVVKAQVTPQGPPIIPTSSCSDLKVANFSASKLELSKPSVSKSQPFNVYFEGDIPDTVASGCTDADKSNYEIAIYVYNNDWGITISSLLSAYNNQISYPVSFFQENGKSGFRQRIDGITLDFLFSSLTSRFNSFGADNKVYAYWHKKGVEPANPDYVPSGGVSLSLTDTDSTAVNDTSSWPDIPGISRDQTTVNQNGPATLFGFILRVIAYIVVAITSVIYWIFSYILVPVLNALLRIRPYRDTFVNVIYPGWLIMRNLANIAFIIALLVMGLRVLFQLDQDSGKTRTFIITLILMALLVNFSLVIAQGIVAIADTIQSQFLPADTKVIEALGKALMADPALAFQTKISGIEDGSATADLFRPIMLLITSVAGFFAFVAVTAFVAIRTVALWAFYLTSPFAYFGRVLQQTRKYAEQWWEQFFKYVFMVPILVFFLNIAALMAGTLARQNSINPDATSNLFSDQAIAGLEGVVLTVISQAVVLIFLFIGMEVASKSGTYGAKGVVNFAKSGFKNTFSKPPKWANIGKDIGAYWAARGADRAGKPGLAKAITAGAKPVEFAGAVKKKWMDDAEKRRKEYQAGKIGDIPYLTRSSYGGKLGASLKGAREKMKDFERDDADYLSARMAESHRKGDRDALAGSMLKMGQEGHFKDMLAEAGHLNNKTYTEDAAGLNDMTADMVKSGKLSDTQRTDLLDEFDKASKKKRSNAHYGGNTSYNRATDKTEVRKRDAQQRDGFATTNPDNPYLDEKSWTRVQIKARTGDDPKGALKKDLTEAHQNAAVKGGEFTDAQVGIFANEQIENLRDRRIWDAAMKAKPEKMQAMRDAFTKDEQVERVRQRMIQYYEALPNAGGLGTAEDKANQRINILRNQLFNGKPPSSGSVTSDNPGVAATAAAAAAGAAVGAAAGTVLGGGTSPISPPSGPGGTPPPTSPPPGPGSAPSGGTPPSSGGGTSAPRSSPKKPKTTVVTVRPIQTTQSSAQGPTPAQQKPSNPPIAKAPLFDDVADKPIIDTTARVVPDEPNPDEPAPQSRAGKVKDIIVDAAKETKDIITGKKFFGNRNKGETNEPPNS